MSGPKKSKVGRDSVEPSNERSEASRASVKDDGNARGARAGSAGKQGSTESRPTRLQDGVTPYRSASEAGTPTQAPPLRFIDLFCGIGGFRIAFERAGAKCVFSSDWDRFSQQA